MPRVPGLAFFEYGMTLVMLTASVLPMFVVVFGVIYVVNAVRSWRTGRAEPMLVGQVVTGAMLTISFQIFLIGLTVAIWAVVEGEEFKKIMKWTGGPILGGLISGLYPMYLYFARMHPESSGQVLRQGLGVNAVFTGLTFTASLTLAITLFLNEADNTSLPMIIALMYFLANILCVAPLLKDRDETPLPVDV